MSSDSHPRVPKSVRYQAVDLSEISSGEGVETEGGSQLFETQKKEGSWKMGR